MPQDTLMTEVNVLGYLHPASLQLFAECSAVFQTESWTLEELRIWWTSGQSWGAFHEFPYRIRRKVEFHPFKKVCLWRNWLEFWFFQVLCANIGKFVSHGHLAWLVPFQDWPWDGHYNGPNDIHTWHASCQWCPTDWRCQLFIVVFLLQLHLN